MPNGECYCQDPPAPLCSVCATSRKHPKMMLECDVCDGAGHVNRYGTDDLGRPFSDDTETEPCICAVRERHNHCENCGACIADTVGFCSPCQDKYDEAITTA